MSERKQTPDVLGDLLGAAAVSSEVPPTPSRPPRQAAPRRPVKASESPRAADREPHWEYLVVSCQYYRGWRPRYESGTELAGWMRGPLLHQYLEAQGRERWELVAASSGNAMFGAADYYQLFLRRPSR